MSIAKWTLIFCFGRKPAFPERRLKLGVAPTPISTAALRYDRLTSTPAVPCAQIAVIAERCSERVKATLCCPSRSGLRTDAKREKAGFG